MSAGRADDDEDALSWEGDEPSVVEPVETPVSPVEPASPVEPVETKPATPALQLVTYGVIAGIFLIYTLGWVITVGRSGTSSSEILVEAMAQLGKFLAIASPALWFGSVFLLTRHSKPLTRLLLLVVGLIVVIPWPFVLGV